MKKHPTNLNGEQNDTGNLLVSHRICHFRAIQSFDIKLSYGRVVERACCNWGHTRISSASGLSFTYLVDIKIASDKVLFLPKKFFIFFLFLYKNICCKR